MMSTGEDTASKGMPLPANEYWEKINSLFPLPPKPQEMCHDEFINQLLAPYVLKKQSVEETVVVEEKSSISEANSELAFRAKMYMTNMPARTRLSTTLVRPSSLSAKLRDSALITKQMFQVRFANLISDFRNVCIIYQLLQLQEILNVMREYPPTGVNPNETIFVWSCRKNLQRFGQQTNTVYVDMLEKNHSESTLDNLKYYVDLSEIINLVEVLLNDVVNDRDLCEPHGFIDHLRDTQMDIDEVIAAPYETIMAEHDALMEKDAKKNIVGKFHNPHLAAKQKALKKERFQLDYMSPIETRYRVNWAYDNVEQEQYTDFCRCKALTDELEQLADLTRKDESVWDSCQLEYVTLIEQYKNRINEVQAAYDEDLETATNLVQATTNRLNKCHEDLKILKEKVEMFHRKIQEVRDKIALEEQKQRARTLSVRSSKRASRVSAKQKAGAKESIKQEKLEQAQAKREAKKMTKEQAKPQKQAKKEAKNQD